jgi:hypothetical protein
VLFANIAASVHFFYDYDDRRNARDLHQVGEREHGVEEFERDLALED